MPLPYVSVPLNVRVEGALSAGSFAVPGGGVTDDSIAVAAGIQASKLQHQQALAVWLCDHATDFVATRRAIHEVYGATGTLLMFKAGCTVPPGAATTVTVQLKKGGVNILSAAIALDNTAVAYVSVDTAAFTSADLVAGDILEVDATIAGTNEPRGVWVSLVWREDAAP